MTPPAGSVGTSPPGALGAGPAVVVAPAALGSVRAVLRAGTVVVVRDHDSVQVGLAPDRAVVVGAPASCGPRGLASLLADLEGGADLGDAAARAGVDSADLPSVARILVRLAELGHVRLTTPGILTGEPDPATLPPPVRRVHILGNGQVSEVLRGPLSVNGCRVTTGPNPGLTFDPDRPPWHRRGPAPDLVILTGSIAIDPVVTAALTRSGQVHLHVYCRDGRVVVGPTVLPGISPCLRCIDLFRARRDPRWPFVAAQLVGRSPEAGVPALTAAAALVLAEVAASREPGRSLQTVGASVEINPAEGLWRRLEWPAARRCTCGAAAHPPPLS
ncbi:hypothetical protein [Rhodococcus sp. IEGM 1408]|uniref:hypothetical protein n=1 Tax=Rhodococcus sp. IEGM 1408 TaxID=3082220 RepID=UPI00295570F1|nr:hypothetical protein [Rhodococcus sp. IEGM 1408]MDV8000846.1 hypothetical protein [Rhodococcus sp. IEGM 1408]